MRFQKIILKLIKMLIKQKAGIKHIIRSAFHRSKKHVFRFTDPSIIRHTGQSLKKVISAL